MKRARIQRKGKQFVLPLRENPEDVARDQECLDAVAKEVSLWRALTKLWPKYASSGKTS